MKSEKYRAAARRVLVIGLLLALVSAAAYCALTYFEVFGWVFCWEYLFAPLAVAVLFALISLILQLVAHGCAKREWRLALEIQASTPVLPCEEEMAAAVENDGKRVLKLKITPAAVKQIGMIVIPVVAMGVVAVVSAKAGREAQRAKNRREFYKWFG